MHVRAEECDRQVFQQHLPRVRDAMTNGMIPWDPDTAPLAWPLVPISAQPDCSSSVCRGQQRTLYTVGMTSFNVASTGTTLVI